MAHTRFTLAAALCLLVLQVRGQYCTTDPRYTEVAVFDSAEITLGANIQYGIALDYLGNPDTLLFDLYYPSLVVDTSAMRPFVLLFHGGGFSSGDKQSGDIRDLCIHLAMRGFVVASANYRLGHDFSEYGQYKARYRAIQDGNAAMRFIAANAGTVGIDTAWLFVGGQSAGSLLALGMVHADESEVDSVSLQYGAIALSAELGGLHTSGNTLPSTYTLKGVFNNWGGAVESEVDPEEMLPTVAFHGELDTVVGIDADASFAHYTLNGSRAIHASLQANSICTELTVDTTGEHGIFRNTSSRFRAQRASCFFKSVFCGTCVSFYTTDSVPSTCSSPTGSQLQQTSRSIGLNPVPMTDELHFSGPRGDWSLVDLHGRTLMTVAGTERGTFEVGMLPAGSYLLHWRGGMGEMRSRLVVK